MNNIKLDPITLKAIVEAVLLQKFEQRKPNSN